MLKTRIISHDDGRTEILRILAADALDAWSKGSPLSYEKSIVWLGDIEQLPFVRMAWVNNAKSRRGALTVSGNVTVVGYAKLTPDAPRNREQCYCRRVFYLRDSDLASRGFRRQKLPDSAVDPRTVLPGCLGQPPGDLTLPPTESSLDYASSSDGQLN